MQHECVRNVSVCLVLLCLICIEMFAIETVLIWILFNCLRLNNVDPILTAYCKRNPYNLINKYYASHTPAHGLMWNPIVHMNPANIWHQMILWWLFAHILVELYSFNFYKWHFFWIFHNDIMKCSAFSCLFFYFYRLHINCWAMNRT